MISEEQFLKWLWMADWCKDTEISPYKSENWSNAEKAYNDKFNSESEIKLLEEKYGNGDYICVARWEHKSKLWYEQLVDNPFLNNHLDNATEIKLIHKKHKDILDAYLADNSVEIEYEYSPNGEKNWWLETNFIDEYNEHNKYRLKQQYPIFKRNENGEVFKITNDKLYSIVLSKNSENIGEVIYYCNSLLNSYETIPFDEERGLYHLQPVWCWDDGWKQRNIRCYTNDGLVIAKTSNQITYRKWDNIEPITPEQLETMPFIWDMYQQVLKDKQ